MLRAFGFLILILLSNFSNSQSLIFQQFLINKENPDTKYNLIYFGYDGMMWVGTSDGLYQYDGEDFALYTLKTNNFNNEVSAVFQDKSSIIWVGYKNGGIAKLTGDSLQLFNPEEGLPKKTITSIFEGNNGVMWFTTSGEGIYFFLNNRLYNINEDDGLSDNYTYKTIEDNQGNIWVGTDQGITMCKADVKNKIVKKLGYDEGLPDEIIRDLFKDVNGNIWIGTQDKGICKYDTKRDRIEIPTHIIPS